MKAAGFVTILCLLCSFQQEKSLLNIEISNIRNNRGIIRLSLYTAENQYPYHPDKTYVIPKDSLNGGQIKYQIRDLKPGQYGLCCLDDENRSGQMENNILGIPLEGYGFANNVNPRFKRPEYQRILFNLAPGINHMQLIIRYKN